MHRLLPVLTLLCACGNPVQTCTSDDVDCCTSDKQCLDHFGSSFSFCDAPGRQTGQCVECRQDLDCGPDGACLEDDLVGWYCAPE